MTDIREEDFEIEQPKKKVPVYVPKKVEEKKEEKKVIKEEPKEVYIEKMNKVYEPNGMKLIDKDDLKKIMNMAWIFGAIASILFILLLVNIFWINGSIKDGKFQSTINTPVNVNTQINSTCPVVVYNNYTSVTNINNYENGIINNTCSNRLVNVFLNNVTITNSTIVNSSLINSTII